MDKSGSKYVAHLHGVCLASTRLSIGEDGAVESLQNFLHDWEDCLLVQPLLPCILTEHLQYMTGR